MFDAFQLQIFCTQAPKVPLKNFFESSAKNGCGKIVPKIESFGWSNTSPFKAAPVIVVKTLSFV